MTQPTPSLDSVLLRAAETRGKLDATEQYWKRLRAESRANALTLIFDHGYSLSKTSQITGHHRSTLNLWVQIESARLDALEGQ